MRTNWHLSDALFPRRSVIARRAAILKISTSSMFYTYSWSRERLNEKLYIIYCPSHLLNFALGRRFKNWSKTNIFIILFNFLCSFPLGPLLGSDSFFWSRKMTRRFSKKKLCRASGPRQIVLNEFPPRICANVIKLTIHVMMEKILQMNGLRYACVIPVRQFLLVYLISAADLNIRFDVTESQTYTAKGI